MEVDRSGRGHLAIALVSAQVLLFEVLVTRVLSVVLWYHYVFLSVSLAMLALGAPGVWLGARRPGPDLLPRALLVAAVLTPVSVLATVHAGPAQRGSMIYWTFVLLLPLLAAGTAVVALLLEVTGKELATRYGADLLGATLGALLVTPLLSGLPTPRVVAALGVLPAIAVLLIAPSYRRLAGVTIVGVVALVSVAKPFALRYTKMYDESVAPLHERWTPTARLAVFPSQFILRAEDAFGWGMGALWVKAPLEQLWLEQDGSAGTPITRWDGTAPLPHLSFDVTSAPYQALLPERVCILGAGGGRDILTAIKHGARYVDAVELNPYTIDLVSGPLKSYSGDPYHLAGVRAVASEGRSFLTHTKNRYDLLQISLIDTWAATSAGAYALSENGLYTVEAFQLYLNRLTEHGVLTVSRWASGARQLEMSRLMLLAKEALSREGIVDGNRHLVLLTAGEVGNLMVLRAPVDDALLKALDKVAFARGFSRRWPMPPGAPPQGMIQMAMVHGPAPFAKAGFDLSPPTDDRPFFFQTLDVRNPPDKRMLASMSENEHAVMQLRRLFVIVAGITLALFFLPFVLSKRLPRAPGFGVGTVYFAAIGLGFMFLELPLVQRLGPYLGHPSRATVVVLGTMLAGAGLGSMLSSRVPPHRALLVPLLVPVLAFVLSRALGPVIAATLGASLTARVAFSVALVAPVAFAMGFCFPVGMGRFGDKNRGWFWAVNGATSVLASVSTLVLSLAFGLSRVLLVGVLCYGVAALLLRSSEAVEEG